MAEMFLEWGTVKAARESMVGESVLVKRTTKNKTVNRKMTNVQYLRFSNESFGQYDISEL